MRINKTETIIEAPVIFYFDHDRETDHVEIWGASIYGKDLDGFQLDSLKKDYGIEELEDLCREDAKEQLRAIKDTLAENEYELRRTA